MNIHDDHWIIPELEHATHAVALWIDHSLRHLGVSQAEAHVLAHLAQHPSSSINALHTSFGHKRSTLTGILDRLEGRGWLRREAHPTSRREVAIALTDAGRPVAAEVDMALRGVERQVQSLLNAEDVTAYLRVLHTLTAAVDGKS